MKKQILAMASVLLLSLVALTACSGEPQQPARSADDSQQTSQPAESMDGQMGDAEGQTQETASMASFQTVDLAGNQVDQSIFASYDLTMVNLWATFCGNCIDEMPDLATISQDYQDKGVQVVGIVLDVYPVDGEYLQQSLDLVQDIVDQTGVQYPQLLLSDSLMDVVMTKTSAVPYTFFVDKDGNEVGAGFLGAKDLATFQIKIEQALEDVK